MSITVEAESKMKFFFGKVVANRVHKKNQPTVTEHTGIWWINKEDLHVK